MGQEMPYFTVGQCGHKYCRPCNSTDACRLNQNDIIVTIFALKMRSVTLSVSARTAVGVSITGRARLIAEARSK
jgi:hypothetical protein